MYVWHLSFSAAYDGYPRDIVLVAESEEAARLAAIRHMVSGHNSQDNGVWADPDSTMVDRIGIAPEGAEPHVIVPSA